MNKFQSKENLPIFIKCINLFFASIIIFLILVLFFAIFKIYSEPSGNLRIYIFFLIISLTGIVILIYSFRLQDSYKVNFAIIIFSLGISVYAFEIYLYVSNSIDFYNTDTREYAAKKLGKEFDERSRLEVIDDLNDQGLETYPNYLPSMLIQSKKNILPIGQISNITTILNNEAGYYPVVQTDEYGFINPKNLYKKKSKDIVIIGDSFAEGYSVQTNETIAYLLREQGYDLLNFARGNSGTLIQYAALKEYAQKYNPTIVLWFYYVNDIYDLEKEIKSEILMNYLQDKNYNQNLMNKQEEINLLLRSYLLEMKQRWTNDSILNKDILKIIKLNFTRSFLSSFNKTEVIKNTNNGKDKALREKIFQDIFIQSKKTIEDWGGQLYFVYLPPFMRYIDGNEHEYRSFVFNFLQQQKIPIIDIHSEVFESHPDPASLCPLRRCGHYNSMGYKLIVDSILNELGRTK